MSSVICEAVEKLLEQEQDFPLTNTDSKLLGFKPFERKVLSKWNFLYPSDSHALHQNLDELVGRTIIKYPHAQKIYLRPANKS